jgi:hypothetical protein
MDRRFFWDHLFLVYATFYERCVREQCVPDPDNWNYAY